MFLPVTEEDMRARGWEQPDFVLVTGDAYVDHHSFGTAILSRLLERYGYRVCILAQPDYHSAEDFRRFGKPRLGFLINSGTVDSMVNHYSVFLRKRKTDVYSPGGEPGRRPDRAVIVYANRAREAYGDVPIIIGGIEASLRRMGHYDYWSDRVRRSILLDAKADLLLYGMGERALLEVAEALAGGLSIRDITWIRGTVYRAKSLPEGTDPVILPAFGDIAASQEAYAKSFGLQYRQNEWIHGRTLAEPYDAHTWIIQNPPQEPLSQMELDDVYELPFENEWHPMYDQAGGIPAFREVKFSLVANRGCYGGCAFCALTYHQGREVRGRSQESLLREAAALTEKPDFKGYLHDVGGPTANFTGPACKKQAKHGVCRDRDCLYPGVCPNIQPSHKAYLETLRALRTMPKVKKVFIRSGIRYDYLMADPDRGTFLRELCEHHVSGTLKVAPEHIADNVLAAMRKPGKDVFLSFVRAYEKANARAGKKQYLIPYFISSHPGCTLQDAVELALFLADFGFVPDQVQDFYPTPGTLATCMYYTGMDPLSGRPVYVPRDRKEKAMQRALIHFHKAENQKLVREALIACGREDAAEKLLGRRNGHGQAERAGKGAGKGKKTVRKGRRR